MDVTGVDSVFLARGPAGPALEAFLDGWLARWPALRVAVDGNPEHGGPGDGSGFLLWDRPGRPALPVAHGAVYVERDAGMDRFWDEHGYAPDAAGEGPFALLYQPPARSALTVRALQDPYQDLPSGGSGYEPYGIELVGAGLTLVTTVTPGPPGDPFTDAVHGELRRALAAQRDPV
ncbi:hypothetical protein [Streptomyces globosus]|uniref:hypothetical protein n=1 Tax=Streptomyces globosus TaxID=68209 RepID=UPI00362CF196